MDRVSFDLVYDGPALSEHKMDVRDLAPALAGTGDLIRDANNLFNKDLAGVRVLVNSEHSRGCFSISLELLQTLFEAAKGLLGSEGVKTAKEILEWLDLLKPLVGGAAVGGLGVFGYYRWRAGRPLSSVQSVRDVGPGGMIRVEVQGDNNSVNISPIVFAMAHDSRIARDAKKVIAPLNRPGIEQLRTTFQGRPQLNFDKEDAKAVIETTALVQQEGNILSKGAMIAHLTPYDAQFDPEAKQWQFRLGGRPITVDISDTPIARNAVERRSVSMDDVYKVDLEVTEHKTPTGQIRTDYKARKLLGHTPGPKQDQLFHPKREDSEESEE